MFHYTRHLVTVVLLLLLSTSLALGASVSVMPSGNGVFVLQGNNMDGVSGIDLVVKYDGSALSSPKVTQGSLASGGMFVANPNFAPSTIKIAIITTIPFSGSGPFATITFVPTSASAPLPTVTYNMIDGKGSPIASSTTETTASGTITSPGAPFSPTAPAGPATPAGTTGTSVAGTVTLPTDLQQHTEPQPATPSTPPAYTEEPATAKVAEQSQPSAKPAADVKPEETPQYIVYKGILDRFKQHDGSKKLAAMVAIFDKKVAQSINQQPEILLSDGQSKATLTVDIPARITTSPNFAVNGGKLVSFKQDKQIKGRWIVEVLPEAGTIKVTVTIITGAEEFEYPLTVAPPVKTALTLDESGWIKFLVEIGKTGAPLHDLNNDGVRDYKDEYIFVANMLAKKSASAKPKKPVK